MHFGSLVSLNSAFHQFDRGARARALTDIVPSGGRYVWVVRLVDKELINLNQVRCPAGECGYERVRGDVSKNTGYKLQWHECLCQSRERKQETIKHCKLFRERFDLLLLSFFF